MHCVRMRMCFACSPTPRTASTPTSPGCLPTAPDVQRDHGPHFRARAAASGLATARTAATRWRGNAPLPGCALQHASYHLLTPIPLALKPLPGSAFCTYPRCRLYIICILDSGLIYDLTERSAQGFQLHACSASCAPPVCTCETLKTALQWNGVACL